ncbi:MAG TPA: DUF3089 domain-containing protein [Thermoleophilaceae bacterium]
MNRLAVVLVALCAALAAVPNVASAKVKWLCAPGVKKNPCTPSMKTTVFSSWNSPTHVVTPAVARRPKVDCFYVYPTVSNQSGDIATKAVDPELRSIALFQAARYSQLCRVFAPVYRQVTVQGLNRGKYSAQPADGDLLEAWKLFLSKYSKGRGFVLIGHSQGSFRLVTLIRKQIDANAKLRNRLLSAILLGGNVTVKQGSDRGGSFQNIPACTSNTQLHCVLAFSSYNQTPPDDSFFGRTPPGSGLQVLCTNPAALGGGPANLDSLAPSKPFAPGTLISAGIQLLHFDYPKVPTPWAEATAAFSGECSTDGGASFLKVTSNDGTPVPTPSPNAAWGLHLMDSNLAWGDLLRVLQAEIATYRS